ncbi:tetratricopeptide repeat protein [Hankyongella ginsenosidimutans]|uniref:tetratricopeptide repeat protein n=1 Tax=Hankyongella ginsenosidimutans TaxID=1763828 RepID=UPI001FE74A62|nr:tetratricopeptide repeat protein [Hankyongella ginsenosidimutans]
MLISSQAPAKASAVVDATIETFAAEVLEPSRTQLVLVDFWALVRPVQDADAAAGKAANASKGRIKLVKVDIDKNQMLAGQFRVQSVPTVYAFLDGRPVDGFMGAVSEGQLTAFLDRLLGALPEGDGAPDLTDAIAAARALQAEGALDEAEALYAQILEVAPDAADAKLGLAELLIARGAPDAADELLSAIAADPAHAAAVARLKAGIALARSAGPAGDLAGLRAAAAAAPDDLQARYDYANGLVATGNAEAAADELLAIVAKDRAWNDGAARTRLLTLLEAVGLDRRSPWPHGAACPRSCLPEAGPRAIS